MESRRGPAESESPPSRVCARLGHTKAKQDVRPRTVRHSGRNFRFLREDDHFAFGKVPSSGGARGIRKEPASYRAPAPQFSHWEAGALLLSKQRAWQLSGGYEYRCSFQGSPYM